MPYPHVPAAFINAIAEEGTKDEAVAFLQEQWNETCALRAALAEIVKMHPDPRQLAHILAVAALNQ